MISEEIIAVVVVGCVLASVLIYASIRKIRQRAESSDTYVEIFLTKNADGKDIYIHGNKSPGQLETEKRARNFRIRAKAACKVRGATSTNSTEMLPSIWDERLDDSKFGETEEDQEPYV